MTEQSRNEGMEFRLRLHPLTLAGGLLIALQMIVRAGVAFGAYFWHDDFRHVQLARDLGLTRRFLISDYGGHLEMGPNFLYRLLGPNAGLSFVPAALNLLV